MKRISSCLFRQRMSQQPALERLARRDQLDGVLKIAPGLFLGPFAGIAQRFEMEQRFVAFKRMAVVAAPAAGPLFGEDRLDPSHEEAEIGWRSGRRQRNDDERNG